MKSLVVGVIGLRFGAQHLKGAIDNGATIGAICDLNEERVNEVGEEHGIAKEKRTTNWLDIVNNKEINTVILATPDMTHREQVCALLANAILISVLFAFGATLTVTLFSSC